MIEINVTTEKGSLPVTVLHIAGKLDGSNYDTLIEEAQKLFNDGSRDLVLDLARLTFISSAGISALHRVALLFRGKPKTELEEGWNSFHAIERDRNTGTQQHVKLLNPAPEVEKILKMVGFDAFFEIYTDLHGAVASFQ